MNLKGKISAVVAALALTATMGLTTVSADGMTHGDVSATLDDTTVNSCSFNLGSVDGDFGTYTWDGSGYAAPQDEVLATFNGGLDATGAPGNRACDVTYSATDMTLEGVVGAPVAFTNGQIEISVDDGTTYFDLSASRTVHLEDVPVGGVVGGTLFVRLVGLPDSSVEPGVYKSTITFSIVAAD